MHDIDQRLKFNSRAVNEIERLVPGTRRDWKRNVLATEMLCRDEFALGGNIMSKQLLVALLGAGFACATLSAQEHPLIHQPTLTPQDSGTTNGLIAVSPVNPQVVWASGRNGTFTVTTDGGETWNAGVVPGAEALQFRDVQALFTKHWTAAPPGRSNSRTRNRMVSMMRSHFGRRIVEFCMATQSMECFLIFAQPTE